MGHSGIIIKEWDAFFFPKSIVRLLAGVKLSCGPCTQAYLPDKGVFSIGCCTPVSTRQSAGCPPLAGGDPSPVLLSHLGLPAHGLCSFPLLRMSAGLSLCSVFTVSAIFRYVVSVAPPKSAPLIQASIVKRRCGPILVHASVPLALYSFCALCQFRGCVSGPLSTLKFGVYVLAGWVLFQLSDFGQASVC